MGGCVKAIAYIIFFPFVLIYWIYKAIKKGNSNANKSSYNSYHSSEMSSCGYQFDPRLNYDKQSKIVSIFTQKWGKVCKEEYIALDFETTGLDKTFDRIIEIAAIKYVNRQEVGKFVTLVNPQRPIPSEAQAVNHITNQMVFRAPIEKDIIPQLISFLGSSLIVGHNVNFDLGFLEIAAQRCGMNVKYNYIDTISVSRKLFPGLSNYKLGTIANCMNFDTSKLHRAESDVRVCAEIITVALDSIEAHAV